MAPAIGGGLGVGLLEEVELELGGAPDHEAPVGRPLDLAPQHLAGRDLDGGAVGVGEVAQHHRRARHPGQLHQGGQVEMTDDVAVAEVPVGEGVAGLRVHVDVDAEQVVTRIHAVVHDVVEEEAARHALADGATLQVREGHDHGVDPSAGDVLRELREIHAPLLPCRATSVHKRDR